MALPSIDGTEDDDTNLVASEASIISGYAGDDSITGSAFSDQIFGGNTQWREGGLHPDYAGAFMFPVGDSDIINAGAGDDFIMVGTGSDTIDGGENYDQLNFQFAKEAGFTSLVPPTKSGSLQYFKTVTGILWGVRVDFVTGIYGGNYYDGDKLVGQTRGTFKNIESVLGSVGNDRISGDDKNNAFKPINGKDIIDGRGGYDILSYNDLAGKGIVLDYRNRTVIDGFGGKDTFSNIEIVLGGKNKDTMLGAAGNDRFTGNAGSDEIDGAGGRDTVDYSWELGARGIAVNLRTDKNRDTFGDLDTLVSIENVIGTSRDDRIEGSDKVDETLWGREGNDELKGNKGSDTLWGSIGDDTLDGGADYDVLNGEAGNDRITDNKTSADFVSGGKGNKVDGGIGNDTIKALGVLHGGADNDTIEGAGRLYGDAGEDMIRVGSSKIVTSTMEGGAGNDTLIDTFDHSSGWYGIASYAYATAGVVVDLESGRATVAADDVDTLGGIVAINGSAFGDTINGTSGKDYLFGAGGGDSINGLGGEDVLDGGAGNDTISGTGDIDGGGGMDTILATDLSTVSGGADADTIIFGGHLRSLKRGIVDGGSGKDTITVMARMDVDVTGGAGSDTFVIEHPLRKYGLFNIMDFDKRTERIDLQALDDFVGLGGEKVEFTFDLLMSLAQDVRGGVEIGIPVNIFIEGLTKAELRADDFIL